MAFPETPRVIYEKNTLEEVRCDIRFPPILAIDATPPAVFQDQVRAELPYFDVRSTIKMPSGTLANLTKLVERDLSGVGNKSYLFTSEDRYWTLTLTKNSLSLTCRRYERWEKFQERLRGSLESLARVYRPSFFEHTCVRFKNSVRRKQLGLDDSVAWSALINPWASGVLGAADVASDVEAVQSKGTIRLSDGIGRIEALFSLGVHQPSKESAFIIESHCYHDERKGLHDVFPRLEALHGQAGFFFRWCITDKLHRAMRPVTV